MAVLNETEQTTLILGRLQAGAVGDTFTQAEIRVALNDAYADLWEVEGGGFTRVAAATAWATAPTADALGFAVGILTNIKKIVNVFASATSGSTGDVASGDTVVDGPVDISRIHWQRANATRFGSYNRPVMYSVARMSTSTPADVNKQRLEFWPGVASIYLPIHYIKEFVPLDGASVTTMDLTDLGSRDAALLAAARLAPLAHRPDFVPALIADISQRTQEVLDRKLKALMSGDQDR